MTFKPAPFPDGRRGLVVASLLAVLDLLLILLVLSLPASGLSFLILLLALGLWVPILFVAWRTWLCLSLAYWVDRNTVTVVWGPLRQVIPLGQIAHVVRGQRADPRPDPLKRWPRAQPYLRYGPDLDVTCRAQDEPVTCLASRPLSEQLLLVTLEGTFGISPADPEGFLAALQAHHQLGPTHLNQLARRHPGLVHAAIWGDRLGLGLLAAGFTGSLVLLGLLMLRYLALVKAGPWEARVDSAALFLLPAFAFAIWILNGVWGLLVYDRQRVAAGLLWGGTLAAQAATLVALLTLLA